MSKKLLKKCLLLFSLFLGFSYLAEAQTIKGVVTDERGDPLPGLNVIVKGSARGGSTNFEGAFEIKGLAPGAYTLVFSYIGYKTEEKLISLAPDQNQIVNVQMKPNAKLLDELVVVGYDVQRKRDVVGSISKIDGKSTMDMPAPSFEAALQGKATGVQITQSSGIAGGNSLVRIRGTASLTAGGDPLYVVDGIPISNDVFMQGDAFGQNFNPIAFLNPNDIESIEILKDASATGIYGSRGANGVILITTKRGVAGKGRTLDFNFNTRLSTSDPARRIRMLNNKEYLQLRQEAWENDGNVGRVWLPQNISWDDAMNTNTNWFDETMRTGIKQEYNFSARVGGKKLGYYLGMGYSDNQSFLVGNSFKRTSLTGSVDYKPNKKLFVGLKTNTTHSRNEMAFVAWAGGLGQAMSQALPIYPARNPDGSVYRYWDNPLARLESSDLFALDLRSINNISVKYNISPRLTLSYDGGLDYIDYSRNLFEDSLYFALGDRIPRANRFESKTLNYNSFASLAYDVKMPADQKLRVMANAELQRSETYGQRSFNGTNVFGQLRNNPEVAPDGRIDTFNLGRALPSSFLSTFARAHWNYKEKLMVQGTYRIDGSSRFFGDKQWGHFPTIGVGYILSENSYFKKFEAINFLKLKASTGINGNANIPTDAAFFIFSQVFPNSYLGNPVQFPGRRGNPNIGWEKNVIYDGGFEMGLWQDRVQINFTAYLKETQDALVDASIQASAGQNSYWNNIGKIVNKGFELGINSVIIDKKIKWKVDLNLTHNRNEVRDLGVISPDNLAGSGDTRVLVGQPVGVNFLVRFSHVDDATGLPVFLDLDGNPTFQFTEANRVPVGNVQPFLFGGLTNRFSYKNWDLNVLATFTVGGNIYDDAAKRQLGIMTDWNYYPQIFDRWTGPGSNASFPRLTMNPNTYGNLASEWAYNTTQWLYDASFLRIRNITLTYNFPSDFAKKLRLKGGSFSLTAVNLFTFTSYPFWDPEIVRDHNGPQARNLSPNVTYLTPPQERSFSAFLNINF